MAERGGPAATGSRGLVILVGAGPGDPDLITLRGAAALRRADVVVHDSLSASELLDWAPEHAKRIDVGKRGHDAPTRDQAEINGLLVENARTGKVVVRLKGGDPFVYGRGGEEASACRAAGVRFEVVPGVSSALAAAAAAGIPVTDRRHGASLAIVTGHRDRDRPWTSVDWARLSTGADTLVVLMGMRNLEKIVATLISHGRPPATPAAVVMEGATPRQRVVEAPLEELPGAVRRAGLRAPAVIVVGEVTQLRSELAWAEGRPLFGRRVLVTRPADPNDALAQGLRDAGAEVQHHPVLEIVPVDASAALDAALRPSAPYDAAFFTSRNAILQTEIHLGRLGVAPAELATSTLCVGSATAATARRVGFSDIAVPEQARDAETLARWWVKQSDRRGSRCLFPRAEVVGGALPERLHEVGVELVEVVVYRSRPVHLGAALQDLSGFDAIAFASSSAARAFAEAGGEAGAAVLSAIGERTAATLASLGTPAQVVARHPEAQSLVHALARYFEERDA